MTLSPLEIEWRGPLYGVAGYAQEAREFVLGLDALGARVHAVDVPLGPHDSPLSENVERRLGELARTRIGAEAARIAHSFPPRWDRAGGIGRTTFETDRIAADWVQMCNHAEQVWVPSTFNVETFGASGVDSERLLAVPEPIDLAEWTADGDRLDVPGSRGFNFLSVFDWSLRKGWDLLLDAYCAEFTPDDDVALILKIHSSYGQTDEELRKLVHAALPTRAPTVLVVGELLSAADMARLYRTADCFVLPTRGEGWGRPFVEAMAVGLPVIATGWGGQTDYLDDENAYLIEVDGLVTVPEEAAREIPTYRGHRWAEPSVEHLRQLLRRVRDRDHEARSRAERARQRIAAYDTAEVCARIVELLRERV